METDRPPGVQCGALVGPRMVRKPDSPGDHGSDQEQPRDNRAPHRDVLGATNTLNALPMAMHYGAHDLRADQGSARGNR